MLASPSTCPIQVRCHTEFRERCPATDRGKHCCRHWYQYLYFCYAWQLDWCRGPPKLPGVPCAEPPKAPAAEPEADPEDAEADAAAAEAGAEAGAEEGGESEGGEAAVEAGAEAAVGF